MRRLFGLALGVSIAVVPACYRPTCDTSRSHCQGNVLHGCYQVDYTTETSTTDCAAESQVCVEVDTATAICADSATPDARCADDLFWSHSCDGNVLITCSYGYLVRTEDCGFEQCVPVDWTTGCFDTNHPCFTLPDGRYCDGDTMYQCWGHARVNFALCKGCTLDERGRPVDSTGDRCL